MSETNAPAPSEKPKKQGLELLREPFPDHQVNKLPKGTKAQHDCPADQKRPCSICGGWHHPQIRHLDYVGHAALTDRLLDSDPNWNWEPLKFDDHGFPALDSLGGMWIKLTVCGVTRLGYGDAQNRGGTDGVKERIGDALRNAAMRFGAALEFWHKGEWRHEDDGEGDKTSKTEGGFVEPKAIADAQQPTGTVDKGTGEITGQAPDDTPPPADPHEAWSRTASPKDNNAAGKAPAPVNGELATEGMVKTVTAAMNRTKVTEEQMQKQFSFGVASMPRERVNEILTWLRSMS